MKKYNDFITQTQHTEIKKEEAPANSAGGGNIAGIGVGPAGEPGVHSKARQNYIDANRSEAEKRKRRFVQMFKGFLKNSMKVEDGRYLNNVSLDKMISKINSVTDRANKKFIENNQPLKEDTKSFKEYFGLGGAAISGYDTMRPVGSLGKVGNDSIPKDYQRTAVKSPIVNSNLGPGLGTYDVELSMNLKTKKEDLYSDDNPKDTVKGTGYGDAETAKRTLDIIKKVNAGRQMQIVNTLYNRAKHHANQNQGMRDAMKIFKSWIGKNKKD